MHQRDGGALLQGVHRETLFLQEQGQRPERQGLRAGAALWLRVLLQEDVKLPGRQVLMAVAERLLGWS